MEYFLRTMKSQWGFLSKFTTVGVVININGFNNFLFFNIFFQALGKFIYIKISKKLKSIMGFLTNHVSSMLGKISVSTQYKLTFLMTEHINQTADQSANQLSVFAHLGRLWPKKEEH